MDFYLLFFESVLLGFLCILSFINYRSINMKKLMLAILIIFYYLLNAQYRIFYDFEKLAEPEMVVSTLKGMMETGWGKNSQGTKSLFGYQF